MTEYRIRNWDANFETADSRKRKSPMVWIKIPTKHDGKGYRRLMALPDGPTMYGCWVAIVALAAKCPERGVLADADGPLDSADIAATTGMDRQIVERTLETLSAVENRICWIICRNLPESATPSAERGVHITVHDITEQDTTGAEAPSQNQTKPTPKPPTNSSISQSENQTKGAPGAQAAEFYRIARSGVDAGAQESAATERRQLTAERETTDNRERDADERVGHIRATRVGNTKAVREPGTTKPDKKCKPFGRLTSYEKRAYSMLGMSIPSLSDTERLRICQAGTYNDVENAIGVLKEAQQPGRKPVKDVTGFLMDAVRNDWQPNTRSAKK